MDNARRKEKEEGAKKKEVKKEEVRIFTKAEVAKHDTVGDCWMIINGKVYDVTPFVDEHPGGDILMDVRYAPPPRPSKAPTDTEPPLSSVQTSVRPVGVHLPGPLRVADAHPL